MLHFITHIIEVKPYSVIYTFNTNETRLVDLKPLLEIHNSPESIFRKLLDADYFKTVKLDSYGTLSWDNEVDFCPDVLYEMSASI